MVTFDKKNFVLAVAFVILAMVCSFVLGTHRAEPVVEEVVKYVEIIPENNFDTSTLESLGWRLFRWKNPYDWRMALWSWTTTAIRLLLMKTANFGL